MDDDLRTALWNVFFAVTESSQGSYASETPEYTSLWIRLWKKPLDELPTYCDQVNKMVKPWIAGVPWNAVLDLIEVHCDGIQEASKQRAVRSLYNDVLANHLCSYRFIEGKITPVDGESDAVAIETALRDTSPIAGAEHHLQQALRHLGDRANPDYPNSVKESISAIESICKELTGSPRASLGEALKALKVAGVDIHPALEKGWGSIYGYTSSAQGIRHAAIEKPTITQAEARYWLVSCSAFASLLIHLARQGGIVSAE